MSAAAVEGPCSARLPSGSLQQLWVAVGPAGVEDVEVEDVESVGVTEVEAVDEVAEAESVEDVDAEAESEYIETEDEDDVTDSVAPGDDAESEAGSELLLLVAVVAGVTSATQLVWVRVTVECGTQWQALDTRSSKYVMGNLVLNRGDG